MAAGVRMEKVDLAKVIDKVRKLLALGQSPNEHEAALAVAKAQELLAQYDLTMESIGDLKADKRTSIRKAEAATIATEGKTDGWKAELFEAVARSSDCHTAIEYQREVIRSKRPMWVPDGDNFRDPEPKTRTIKLGVFIGFGHDVEAAGYAFSFLVSEIERLAQAYADAMWAEIRSFAEEIHCTHQEAEAEYTRSTGRHPLKAKLYFIKGATSAVCDTLGEEHYRRHRAAQDTNPNAIVLHKSAAIQDFIYMERYGKTKAEYDAEWESKMEVYRRDRQPVVDSRTEEQKRKDEAEWARRYKRVEEAARRQAEREWRETDHHAVQAGREAGEQIRVRPGVNPGADRPKLR